MADAKEKSAAAGDGGGKKLAGKGRGRRELLELEAARSPRDELFDFSPRAAVAAKKAAKPDFSQKLGAPSALSAVMQFLPQIEQ